MSRKKSAGKDMGLSLLTLTFRLNSNLGEAKRNIVLDRVSALPSVSDVAPLDQSQTDDDLKHVFLASVHGQKEAQVVISAIQKIKGVEYAEILPGRSLS